MQTSKSTSQRIRRFVILCLVALVGSALFNFVLAGGIQVLRDVKRGNVSLISTAEAELTNLVETDGSFSPTSDDPQLLLTNPDGYLSNLRVSMKLEGNVTIPLKIYYGDTVASFNEENTAEIQIAPGENNAVFSIHQPVNVLRIDPGQTTLVRFSDLVVEDISDFQQPGFGAVFTARIGLLFLLVLFLGAHLAFPLEELYAFLFRNRFALGFSLVLFGVIFNINGSSISVWLNQLHTQEISLAFGEAHSIRSDEFSVFTPMIFSQSYGDQPYSWFSQILRGTTTDTFMIYALPVKTWAMIFRPFLVGFLLLGNERGLAFFWWARAVCLWLASFQLFLLLTGKQKRLSAAAACMVLFSPLVQWWFAINALPEMLMAGSLFVLLLDCYLRNSRQRVRLFSLLGMVICGGAYILTLYPAWMVPLGYVFLALTLWVILKNRKACLFRFRDGLELLGAVLLLGLCMFYVFHRSSDALHTILNTAYPGHGTSNGGGLLWEPVMYPASLFFSQQTEGGLPMNVCEASTFFDFFPLGLVLGLYILIRKKGSDLLTWLLLGVSLLLGLWCLVGFPEFLAKVTMLTLAKPHRTYEMLSLVNLMLVFRSMALLSSLPPFPAGSMKKPLYLIFGVVGSLWFTSEVLQHTRYYVGSYIDAVSYRNTVAVLVLLIGALMMFFYPRVKSFACLFFAALAILPNLTVNPAQVGVGDLYTSSLAQEVQALVEEDPEALWVVGNGLGLPHINYPILMGARTINATNTYPDLERWAALDPEHKYEDIVNRYSHIFVTLMKSEAPREKFHFLTEDCYNVYLTAEDVKAMGIRYVFSDRNLAYLSGEEVTYTEVARGDGYYVFEAVY